MTLPRKFCVAWFAAAILLVLAAPAGAATKDFSLVTSPSSFTAGSTVTVTATLTNLTDQQQLGSANITAPSGFDVVSASAPAPATTAVSGQVVQLRNAGIQPHSSLAVSIRVTAPCAATSATWSVMAKQSNAFNGPPGNALTLDADASSLSATVSSACALRFYTQPHSARTGETITGSDYQPAATPAVQVEVVDGSGNRVTNSSASISMQLGSTSTGPGALHGTSPVSASSGLATFRDLTIDKAGAYVLQATSPGITSAQSSPFRIDDVSIACSSGTDCSGSISTKNLSASVTAFAALTSGSDFLTMSFDNGPTLDCAGYSELSPDWVVVDATSSARTKSATLIIPKQLMNVDANNGASFLEVCFGSPVPFTVKPGSAGPLHLRVDVDGDGVLDDWYEGLLPDCSSSFPPPCVSGRRKTGAGDGVIVATLPASAADPHMRG